MDWKVKLDEIVSYREYSPEQVRKKAKWGISASGRFKTTIRLGSETPRYDIKEEHSDVDDAVNSVYRIISEYHNSNVRLVKLINRVELKDENYEQEK